MCRVWVARQWNYACRDVAWLIKFLSLPLIYTFPDGQSCRVPWTLYQSYQKKKTWHWGREGKADYLFVISSGAQVSLGSSFLPRSRSVYHKFLLSRENLEFQREHLGYHFFGMSFEIAIMKLHCLILWMLALLKWTTGSWLERTNGLMISFNSDLQFNLFE